MRSYTLEDLVVRLEELIDAENDTHYSAGEKRKALASAIADTWGKMIHAGLGDRFVKLAEFTTVPDQLDYDLEDEDVIEDLDFLKVYQLYVDEGNGTRRPLERISPAEVTCFKAPVSAVPMKLYYIPCAPTFLTEEGEFDDDLTFDGINGWEEHALMGAAVTLKLKKEDDPSYFYRRKKELEEDMVFQASQDASQPARVVRRRRSQRAMAWYPFHGQVSAYGLRGRYLELYYSYPWVP
jgi:hypothetical protein